MRFRVFAKPNSKKESLTWDGKQLVARLNALTDEGKANQRLIELLAKKLKISKSQIKILSGHAARYKTVEVEADINLNFLSQP